MRRRLGGAAAVVGDRGDVADHRDLQAGGLQGADGAFTSGTGALDVDLNGLMPCSIAALAATSAALWAANGVLLREPRKFSAPVLAQEMVLPCVSVM